MILTVILAYVLAQLAIAAWAARGTSTDADYLVAGRRLGVFAVAMSLFATWFGSETVVATSAEVAAHGLSGARVEPFAYGAGILILGLFIVAKLRAGGHMTLADYVGARFGIAAEALSAIAVAVGGTVWAAAQLYALATIITAASDIGFLPALAGATATVLVYTLIGGLIGDVVTDVIQGLILMVILAVLFALMVSELGGPAAAWSSIPAERFAFLDPDESWLERLEVWLIPIMGSIVAQEAISRALGARSPAIARTGSVLGSGIYLVVGLLPIAFGLLGPQLAISQGAGDQFLPTIAEALLPKWLFVVFTGGLLSAIFSSVDSALLAVSAVATETGYRRLRPETDDAGRLVVARGATIAAGLVAFAVAASGESLRELVLASSSIGGIVVVPVILSMLVKGFGGRLAGTAAIATHMAFLVLGDWLIGLPGAALIAAGAALVVYVAIGLTLERKATGPA